MTFHRLLSFSLLAVLVAACGDPADAPTGEHSTGPTATAELGKTTLAQSVRDVHFKDSFSGPAGLPIAVDDSDSAVWDVTADWDDTDTAAARASGMAWGANSGLSWDDKYAQWVDSMERIEAVSYGHTYQLTTPYGRTLPAPALECAETAMFLRATFASWYGLPFFMEASDANGPIYIGHFGFRTRDGRYGNSPNFATTYPNYEDQADTWAQDGWPTDNRLRARHLGGSQDDDQPAIGEDAHAGTYFDEIYLNKRVGHFMIFLLSYYGSINLADPANLFNLDPTAIKAGDPLVKRYQRTGIGHVYVTKRVLWFGQQLEAEAVSGSMPRRQGKWESAAASEAAFTSHYAGGPDENEDGDTYASLGGGLKRWRTPIVTNGRWVNVVPQADRGDFIDATNIAAMGGRIETFENILGQRSPEEQRRALLEQIESSRQHLAHYPASCSARERREETFEELYALEAEHWDARRYETDAAHRVLQDYVLAELSYNDSKTCCWNSTTEAMHEIIMARAEAAVIDHTDRTCHAPPVFMARNGGYGEWADYAASVGRGGEWVEWSEDEVCNQRDVINDTEAAHGWTPWCEVGATVQSGGDPWPGSEPGDPDEPEDPDEPVDPPAPDDGGWSCAAGFAR